MCSSCWQRMLYPWFWRRLNGAVGSRDPWGCSGAREVSDPGVALRKKQKKGINSYSEILGDKSVRMMEIQTGGRSSVWEDRVQDQWGR